MRGAPQGTYLISYLLQSKVIEFDSDFNEIWKHYIRKPWAAIHLHNDNTLITYEDEELTREVDQSGKTLWKIKLSELPEKYRLDGSQSCVHLVNGNTILCSRGNKGKSPQLVEVTPDKKVVWIINDWKNLGPCTDIQILSDPGIPEIP